MNTYQVLQEIKALLLARTWTDGTEKVFAYQGVKVTSNPEMQAFLTLPVPFALIVPGDFICDPVHHEEPDYLVGPVAIKIGVSHQDSIGEAAIIGSNKVGGLISSRGRGLEEIESEVKATLKLLNGIDGVEMQFIATGNRSNQYETQGGYRAHKDIAFELACTADPVYRGPTVVAGAVPGGGAVNLTWTNPAAVASQVGLVLRRSPGAVAPELPTQGVGIAIGAFATSYNDAPGAGQWSYSLFMKYSDLVASILNYSAPTKLTVTAT